MIWKPIPNHYGYDVSDQGDVRSWKPKNGRGGLIETPRLLTALPFKDSKYLRVNLSGKTRRVHQLVLEAFVGPCPANHVVMHIDDNPTNNKLTNLKYGTQKENQEDMVNKGRSCKGEDHHSALVSDVDRIRILDAVKAKQYYGGILDTANDLNIPVNTVRRIVELYNRSLRKEGNSHLSLTFKDRRV